MPIAPAANVVAVVVELGGFLGIDRKDIVFALSEPTSGGGNFVTGFSAIEIEGLSRCDNWVQPPGLAP